MENIYINNPQERIISNSSLITKEEEKKILELVKKLICKIEYLQTENNNLKKQFKK